MTRICETFKGLGKELLAIKSKKAITKIQALIIVAVIIVASASAGWYYYSTTIAAPKDIIIGAPLPLSGSLAVVGQSCKNGHELAEEDINAAGGIKNLGGAKIKIIYTDIQSDTTVAVSETQRLITTYNPAVMTGYYSTSFILASAEVTERNKVPIYTPLSQGVKVTESGFKYVFRNAIKASRTGVVGINSLMEMVQYFGTPVKTIGLVYGDEAALRDIMSAVRTRAAEVGLTIVFDEAYPPRVTDLSTLVSKLKAAKPDVVVVMSFITESILLARTLKEFQVDALAYFGVAGGGMLEPEFIKSLGNTSEYFIGGAGWMRDLNIPGLADVVRRYEDKYKIFMNEHAGQSYASTWVIKEVIELSAKLHPDKPLDGDSIRDAFLNIDIKEGPAIMTAGGRAKFSEIGDNIYASLVYMQILNGTQHTVWPLNMASAKAVWPMPPWNERP